MPMVPDGRLEVVMLSGALAIVSERVLVAVLAGLAESIAVTAMPAEVTAAVGVPVI